MATKAQVTIRGAFPVGTTVGLYHRVGDWFAAGALGQPLKSAKVDNDSEVQFTGLDEHGRYWAVAEVDGEPRHRAVTAKLPREGKPKPQVSPEQRMAEFAAQAQATGNDNIVTGARSTENTRIRGHRKPRTPFALPGIGEPSKGKVEAEPAPAPRQEDVKAIPQMSSTITGSAEITDPKAPQPGLKQEDVPKGTWQASDTELGTAAILEAQPESQDDAGRKPQRSSTEEGSAEVVEKAPRSKKAAKARPKSSSKRRTSSGIKTTTAKKRRKK